MQILGIRTSPKSEMLRVRLSLPDESDVPAFQKRSPHGDESRTQRVRWVSFAFQLEHVDLVFGGEPLFYTKSH